MTISTTRSRFRTIGSATLAAAVGLGMGALTVATAAPASAAAIDKTIDYKCFIVDGDPNGDGSVDIPLLPVPGLVTARTYKTSIPDTVAQGDTIPATGVQIDIDLSAVANAAKNNFGDYAKGNSTNTQVHFGINGVDTPVTLENLAADWMPIPDAPPINAAPGTWLIPVAGTVPAITVPDDATGTITVDGPTSFRINAFHNDTGVDPHVGTSYLDCSADNPDQLRLGTIQVEGTAATPQATLTATAAPSPVDKPATVAFSVAPTSATGEVLLSYQGKQVGKATLAGGAATIEIPAATLPTPGTFELVAEYTGDAGHLADKTSVTVVRTPAAVIPPPVDPDPADAKISAKPKPKKFKIGGKHKLKIKIKSDSDSLAGKIKVKAGKKTLGKGNTNDAGKVTIKLKKITKKYVKKGKIKLKVTYSGNEDTEKAKKTVKVKVKG